MGLILKIWDLRCQIGDPCIRLPSPVELSYDRWQKGDPAHQFSHWNSDSAPTEGEKENQGGLDKGAKTTSEQQKETCPEAYWLPRLLFCQWSQAARKQVCDVLQSLATSRKQDVLRLMIIYLDHVGEAGEAAVEYLDLFCRLITADNQKEAKLG